MDGSFYLIKMIKQLKLATFETKESEKLDIEFYYQNY